MNLKINGNNYRINYFTNRHISTTLIKKPTERKIGAKSPKKDYLCNLNSVVSLLDTNTIGNRCDYENIKKVIDRYNICHKYDNASIFSDEEVIYKICNHFDITLQELVRLLVEQDPEVYTIQFIKNIIKPFIVRIYNEKYRYQTNTIIKSEFKPIFNYI